MNTKSLLVWLVLPYLSIVLFIGGMIWRYRTDQFGWTSRSSQWNEPAILVVATVPLRDPLRLPGTRAGACFSSAVDLRHRDHRGCLSRHGNCPGGCGWAGGPHRAFRAAVPQIRHEVSAPHDDQDGHRHLRVAHPCSRTWLLGYRTSANDCRWLRLPEYHQPMVPLHRPVPTSACVDGRGAAGLQDARTGRVDPT